MNTLKTIITIAIVLFALTSTQQAQAQTKEETIAWIKEKLEKHGGSTRYNSYFTNVTVSPCMISCTHISSDYSDKISFFNPIMAKSWSVNEDKTYIKADAQIIRYVQSNGSVDQYPDIALKNGESDIHERMIKALLHLATFCDEGKNEAF